MSVRVDLHELGERMAEHDFAYLVTVGGEGRAHVVAVTPRVADGALVVDGVGRSSSGNVAARPDVTLVWPPAEVGGYSLIVDGAAAVVVDDATAGTVRVRPSRAVLHRPAPGPPAVEVDRGAADAEACTADCREIAITDRS